MRGDARVTISRSAALSPSSARAMSVGSRRSAMRAKKREPCHDAHRAFLHSGPASGCWKVDRCQGKGHRSWYGRAVPRTEHPLPTGMRDFLPEETRERRHLAQRVLERVALHGYDLGAAPRVRVRGRARARSRRARSSDVLRFVEPESGEVAAFRPDMTPQIARMIATRLASRPPPFRLAYEGTVLRRLSGRARKRRQIPQVGVELVGSAGIGGDPRGARARSRRPRSGRSPRLRHRPRRRGHRPRALLADVDPTRATAIADALGRKDEAEIDDRMREAGGDPAILVALASLESLEDGVRLLAKTPAARRGRAASCASSRCGRSRPRRSADRRPWRDTLGRVLHGHALSRVRDRLARCHRIRWALR